MSLNRRSAITSPIAGGAACKFVNGMTQVTARRTVKIVVAFISASRQRSDHFTRTTGDCATTDSNPGRISLQSEGSDRSVRRTANPDASFQFCFSHPTTLSLENLSPRGIKRQSHPNRFRLGWDWLSAGNEAHTISMVGTRPMANRSKVQGCS